MRLKPFVGAVTIILAATFIFGCFAALSLPSNPKQVPTEGSISSEDSIEKVPFSSLRAKRSNLKMRLLRRDLVSPRNDPKETLLQKEIFSIVSKQAFPLPRGEKIKVKGRDVELAGGLIPALPSRVARLRREGKPYIFGNIAQAKGDDKGSDTASLPGLKLMGTMTGEIPFAFIEDLTTDRQGQYKIGDVVKGAKIVEISRARVILEKDGRRVILDLFPGAVAGGEAVGEAIVTISPTQRVVSKSGLLKKIGNIVNVLGMARVAPSIDLETGKVSGFKIDRIKAKGLAEKAGLKNGDIIRTVNGQELNSPQKAIQIYRKARNQSKIDVNLIREDKSITLKYKIRR